MIKKIYVMSRNKAKRFSYAQHDFTSVIISITDIDKEYNTFATSYAGNGIKNVLHLKFNDVDAGYPHCITKADAEKICNFVQTFKKSVDAIIVHCEAGISRSAGVAAAISKYLFGDDSMIFDAGCYCPNMTCYRMVFEGFCV